MAAVACSLQIPSLRSRSTNPSRGVDRLGLKAQAAVAEQDQHKYLPNEPLSVLAGQYQTSQGDPNSRVTHTQK